MALNGKTESLHDRLKRKDALTAELSSNRAEKGRLSTETHYHRTRLRDVRAELDALSRTAEQDEGRGGAQYHPRLNAVRQDLEDLTQTISTAEHRVQDLQARDAELQEQIEALDAGASAKEVLAHQDALGEAQAEVERLEALVASAEQASEQAASACGDDARLDRLLGQREDLLADMAAGEADQAALDLLDAEIKEIVDDEDSQQARALSTLRDKNQAVNGLRRRLERAQRYCEDVKSRTPGVLEQFLRRCAEEVGDDYLEHAQGLQRAFERLRGIDALMSEVLPGRTESLMPGQWYRMLLPAFNLRAFEGATAHDLHGGVLFSADHALRLGQFDRLADQERERLEAQGFVELAKHSVR
ncbi:hypothetical protein [Halomonas sp.]|uniref:hypothetical protein n=1 Tax=Halomonas sp. TaxID=1486246 RepID=UPI00298E3260|nr:hypothetical protein [Halomonas sp.]MDW7745871.1 hypothetical protein [Halomonas sp.]